MGVNPYKKQMNNMNNAEKEAAVKKDNVEISSAAKELQQSSSITAARQEKVEALKEQVQNGTYKIDVNEVATGIVDFYFKK